MVGLKAEKYLNDKFTIIKLLVIINLSHNAYSVGTQMVTFKEIYNSKNAFSLNESYSKGLYDFKRGDKITLTREDEVDIEITVVGFAYVSAFKIYNKSAAIWSSYSDFLKSVSDEWKTKLKNPDFLKLKEYSNVINKPNSAPYLALIGYQEGKSVGYSRTVTVFYDTPKQIEMTNDKTGPYKVIKLA